MKKSIFVLPLFILLKCMKQNHPNGWFFVDKKGFSYVEFTNMSAEDENKDRVGPEVSLPYKDITRRAFSIRLAMMPGERVAVGGRWLVMGIEILSEEDSPPIESVHYLLQEVREGRLNNLFRFNELEFLDRDGVPVDEKGFEEVSRIIDEMAKPYFDPQPTPGPKPLLN